MAKGGKNPERLSQDPAGCRKAGELLRAGQYAEAAELLRQARGASERAGDQILAHVLAMACRVCLACRQCRAEVEWYRRAGQEAQQRERALRQRLCAILDLIIGRGASEASRRRGGTPTPSAVRGGMTGCGPPEPAEPLGLWQRVQIWLRRRCLSQVLEGEIVVPSAEAPVLFPSAGQVEMPTALPSVLEREAPALSPVGKEKHGERPPPSLVVYCLGPFRVYQDDELIADWPSGKGKAIFKYMVANRDRPISRDILMDLFWRDADPEAARNNLNVAIYGLRQALRGARPDFPHILFEDGHYLLNPAVSVWVDSEEFVQHCEAGRSLERKGKLAEAMEEYEVAESLYQGDFLEEDLYEDWIIPRREGLKDSYLFTLDRLSRYHLEKGGYATCVHLCQKILTRDDCREDAHRRLMRCYSRQGQRNLALRQYHLCVETLARVLEVPPMPETAALYHQIRNGGVG
jgi:DNA-binding SARP family transcriptional activator